MCQRGNCVCVCVWLCTFSFWPCSGRCCDCLHVKQDRLTYLDPERCQISRNWSKSLDLFHDFLAYSLYFFFPWSQFSPRCCWGMVLLWATVVVVCWSIYSSAFKLRYIPYHYVFMALSSWTLPPHPPKPNWNTEPHASESWKIPAIAMAGRLPLGGKSQCI